MPKRDAQYMAEQREKILVAALKEFATRGFQRASMRDVAKRVGVSVGTLYIHFKNKEEVVRGIFDRHMAVFPWLPSATFAEMRAIMRETWSKPVDAEYRREMALSAQLLGEAKTDPKARRAALALHQKSLELFEGGVARDPQLRHLSVPRRRELARRILYWWTGVSMHREDKLGADSSHLLPDLEAGFDILIAEALRE